MKYGPITKVPHSGVILSTRILAFWGNNLPVCILLFALDWPCLYGFGVRQMLHIVQPFECRIYMPKV